MNKYLKELGLDESTCSFNTSLKDGSRDEHFQEQRDTYGFDERETWALDYTAAEWLYCHLRMYLEIGGQVVNLNFHKFTVPILDEKENPNWMYAEDYYDTIETEMTQEEAINYCIRYLADYLQSEKKAFEADDPREMNLIEKIGFEKGRCAFHIFAVILGAMWW